MEGPYKLEDFEKLRLTLREHLHDVLPEREKDKILHLTHDCQAASERIANALFEQYYQERLKRESYREKPKPKFKAWVCIKDCGGAFGLPVSVGTLRFFKDNVPVDESCYRRFPHMDEP